MDEQWITTVLQGSERMWSRAGEQILELLQHRWILCNKPQVFIPRLEWMHVLFIIYHNQALLCLSIASKSCSMHC
jgi:hypothetical protein